VEVAMDESFTDVESELRVAAPVLNALDRLDPAATVMFDLMSGGLVWSDECPPPEQWDALGPARCLWNYRTGLILGAPPAAHDRLWRLAHEVCPRWVALHSDRVTPTPQLIEVATALKARGHRELKVIDRWASYTDYLLSRRADEDGTP
jgi:hypothetical protein